MATHFLKRRCQLAAKVEGTAGTYEAPAAADATCRVMDVNFAGAGGESFPQDLLQADLSELPDLIGNRPVQISFSTLLKGSGTATTATSWGKFLQAAGFDETIGGSDVIYLPESAASTNPLSFALWYGPTSSTSGKLYSAKGCRAQSVTLDITAGQALKASFVFMGAFNDAAEATVFSSPTYESTVPQTCRNLGMTIGSWTPFFSNMTINITNTLAAIVNPGAAAEASGINRYEITGRRTDGTLTFMDVLEADKDWIADLLAGTQSAFTLTHGATSGNKITLSGPKFQFLEGPEADLDGVLGRALRYKFARSAGDDEFKFTTV